MVTEAYPLCIAYLHPPAIVILHDAKDPRVFLSNFDKGYFSSQIEAWHPLKTLQPQLDMLFFLMSHWIASLRVPRML